jgi:hypothetical protein
MARQKQHYSVLVLRSRGEDPAEWIDRVILNDSVHSGWPIGRVLAEYRKRYPDCDVAVRTLWPEEITSGN